MMKNEIIQTWLNKFVVASRKYQLGLLNVEIPRSDSQSGSILLETGWITFYFKFYNEFLFVTAANNHQTLIIEEPNPWLVARSISEKVHANFCLG
jgi:hypothetical protein